MRFNLRADPICSGTFDSQFISPEKSRKIWWRIVPLCAAVILFGALYCINVGFAAVTMKQEIGISNYQFGLAAGCFAIGYALFGIPRALMLHRMGARHPAAASRAISSMS